MKLTKSFLAIVLGFCLNTTFAQNDSKQELKKLADDLTQQIKQKGNKRIAVANFTDQQNNVTELGKYLSQQFIVNLIRNGLDVVDRSRIEDLMEENKMSAKGLLDPKNQTKLGQLAGIEAIVTGTTTPSDKSVELIITVLDIARGSGIAGTDGSISRTDAMNNLLRSNVANGSGESMFQKTPTVEIPLDYRDNAGSILMGDKVLPMDKKGCFDEYGIKNYGQVFLENTLKIPIVLYKIAGAETYETSIMFGVGSRNAAGARMYTGYNGTREHFKFEQNYGYTFYFHTTESNEDDRKYGTIPVLVEGCKIVVRVINEKRIFLSKTKPH